MSLVPSGEDGTSESRDWSPVKLLVLAVEDDAEGNGGGEDTGDQVDMLARGLCVVDGAVPDMEVFNTRRVSVRSPLPFLSPALGDVLCV